MTISEGLISKVSLGLRTSAAETRIRFELGEPLRGRVTGVSEPKEGYGGVWSVDVMISGKDGATCSRKRLLTEGQMAKKNYGIGKDDRVVFSSEEWMGVGHTITHPGAKLVPTPVIVVDRAKSVQPKPNVFRTIPNTP